ncbi:MAG: hypothetical protein WC979_08120 [Candidatus Pacearchaeota archaeon]|jgi:hypothetical protein
MKIDIEKISSQPDHMSEENLRLCDYANSCPSFTQAGCEYEYKGDHKNKCPIAIQRYLSQRNNLR